jgi:hypothetical protein
MIAEAPAHLRAFYHFSALRRAPICRPGIRPRGQIDRRKISLACRLPAAAFVFQIEGTFRAFDIHTLEELSP